MLAPDPDSRSVPFTLGVSVELLDVNAVLVLVSLEDASGVEVGDPRGGDKEGIKDVNSVTDTVKVSEGRKELDNKLDTEGTSVWLEKSKGVKELDAVKNGDGDKDAKLEMLMPLKVRDMEGEYEDDTVLLPAPPDDGLGAAE